MMRELQTFAELVTMAEDFAVALESFRVTNRLPSEWFVPPDHLAYKCRDNADYHRVIGLLRGHYEQGNYVELDGRRLASVLLLEPIILPQFGQIEWLEIMEPRPAKVGKDVVGMEHIEFMYADFSAAEAILNDANINHELQSNPGHEWISIIFGAAGQELKLNNRTLADVVATESANGQTTPL